MHQYVDDLTRNLHVSSLSSRAKNLFDNAMSTGSFRWGRKAKLVAGASLSIAMRESKRPEALRDIATLLQEDLYALHRIFQSVICILKLGSITPSDAHSYIASLKLNVERAIQLDAPEANLSASHLVALRSVDLNKVLVTGRSLIDLLSHHPSTPDISPPSTAGAVFLLAFEAETRATVSKVSQMAAFLAHHCKVGSSTIMRRYQTLEGILLEWTQSLPWLDRYESTAPRTSRVAKRLLIARGLKDVIEWQEDIWKKALEQYRPSMPLLDEDASGNGSESSSAPSCTKLKKRSTTPPVSSLPKKRRRRHPLGDAKHFLVDPLNAPLPLLPLRDENQNPGFPLTTFILAGPSDATQATRLPSRLQLLAVARAGSSADKILDDELFEEDEFESMLRTDDEKKSFLHVWDMNGGDEALAKQNCPAKRPKEEKAKTKRIDPQALTKFFGQEHSNEDLLSFLADEKDDEIHLLRPESSEGESDNGGEDDTMKGWRSFSIDYHSTDNRYEEEV